MFESLQYTYVVQTSVALICGVAVLSVCFLKSEIWCGIRWSVSLFSDHEAELCYSSQLALCVHLDCCGKHYLSSTFLTSLLVPQAFVLVFSVTSRGSFDRAKTLRHRAAGKGKDVSCAVDA